MDPSDEITKSLIQWLQTILPNTRISINELNDGVAICEALIEIAPQHFQHLELKIKKVGLNWRLKISNLKKINESIKEYYQDFLNMQIQDAGKPDVAKLAEMNDFTELGKLLRLVLGNKISTERALHI